VLGLPARWPPAWGEEQHGQLRKGMSALVPGACGNAEQQAAPGTHTQCTASAWGCPGCLVPTTCAVLTWCPGTKGVAAAPALSAAAGRKSLLGSWRGSAAKGEAPSPPSSCGAAAAARGASLASPTGPLAKAEAEDVHSAGSGVGGGTLGTVTQGALAALLGAPAPWMMATEWSRTAATMVSTLSSSSSSETLQACRARPWLSTITAALCSLGLAQADGFNC